MKTNKSFKRLKKYTLQLLWSQQLLKLKLITETEYKSLINKLEVDYKTLV